MTDTDLPEEARELPILDSALENAADRNDVPLRELTDALVVLDADLRGRHSTYETNYEYVTVDRVRAYLADAEAWAALVADFDLDSTVEDAVRAAHTESARLLRDRAVENPQFAEETVGIVVGVDTAEEIG